MCFFGVFYCVLQFEFHTRETAYACKSLCTKHVRHKNPRAIVVPSLRSRHYLALFTYVAVSYLGLSVKPVYFSMNIHIIRDIICYHCICFGVFMSDFCLIFVSVCIAHSQTLTSLV